MSPAALVPGNRVPRSSSVMRALCGTALGLGPFRAIQAIGVRPSLRMSYDVAGITFPQHIRGVLSIACNVLSGRLML